MSTPTSPAEAPEERTDEARHWLSEVDHGAYQCRCWTCRRLYIGPKRSVTCKVCALAATPEGQKNG